MNTKIEELRLLAEGQVTSNLEDPSRLQDWYMNQLIQQKFAELIINECIRVADSQMDSHVNAVNVAPAIKKHFGIK